MLCETRLAWDDCVSSDPLLDSFLISWDPRLTSFRLLGKEFSGEEMAGLEMFASTLDLLGLSMVVTGLLVAVLLLLLSALDLSSVLEAEPAMGSICGLVEAVATDCFWLKSVSPGKIIAFIMFNVLIGSTIVLFHCKMHHAESQVVY